MGDISRMSIGGDDVGSIAAYSFTLETNIEPGPLPALIDKWPITVEGQITAYFTVPAGWIERWENQRRKLYMIMARPHMPRRAFRRLRAKVRVQRKAARMAY